MAETVTVKNRDEFMKALEARVGKYETAAVYGLSQVAFAVEREAKHNIDGKHSKGEPHVTNSTGGPNNVTGALRRSIHTEIPTRKGFGTYSAKVFPTMVYSRRVELGGTHERNGHVISTRPFPYLTPALASVKPKANQIFTAAVARRLVRG